MKHAKQTRAPWILLACLAAIALCIMAAVTLLQPNTNPKNIEIPGTRGNIPATIQLPAKSARGEELPLVVLCHGFTGNRQGDGHFAPLAEDLAAHGIATVRLDFAGCGDSTEPYANYTLANMAADVDSVIGYMQATYGTGKTALVGHSMGGRLASLYPQLGQYPVTALALWSPANGMGLQGLEFLSIDNFAAVEELAARADALDLRRIKPVQQRGNAVADRRPPIGGVLLAPTWMREGNRVFPADDVGNAARFVHQQQLHRRGAEVDPNIVHIFVSSLRKIYPLTPKTFV